MKKQLLFIVPTLGMSGYGGGAERVIATILKYLNANKYDIRVLIIKKGLIFAGDLPDNIKLKVLGKSKAIFSIPNILFELWKYKPDVVITTVTHINVIVGFLLPFFPRKTKAIMRSSNMLSGTGVPDLGYYAHKLMVTSYRMFDLIVCQSNDMKNNLDNVICANKTVVINNPIDWANIRGNLQYEGVLMPSDKYNILLVGRLAYQKGFDRVVKLCKYLDTSFHITILGEGPLKQELTHQIQLNDLDEKIVLRGFTNNPFIYMEQCDLFVLTSRYEGFPNVLIQALACGVPVVAFKCLGGINEIIIHGFNGFLCPDGDIEALAKYVIMAKNMRFDKNLIHTDALNRFGAQYIVNKYEEIID